MRLSQDPHLRFVAQVASKIFGYFINLIRCHCKKNSMYTDDAAQQRPEIPGVDHQAATKIRYQPPNTDRWVQTYHCSQRFNCEPSNVRTGIFNGPPIDLPVGPLPSRQEKCQLAKLRLHLTAWCGRKELTQKHRTETVYNLGCHLRSSIVLATQLTPLLSVQHHLGRDARPVLHYLRQKHVSDTRPSRSAIRSFCKPIS